MEDSVYANAQRTTREPAVVVSALGVWVALTTTGETRSSLPILAASCAAHVGLLLAVRRFADPRRARAEIAASVLLPALGAAFVEHHAAASLELVGVTFALFAAALHVGITLDHAQRRRPVLAATQLEPTRPVTAPVRRRIYRSLLLAATFAVTLVSLARAVSLRADASLSSTWGDAAAGASILAAAVPIVLGAHLALSVIAPRFRRGQTPPGGLSRLIIWGALATAAAVALAMR